MESDIIKEFKTLFEGIKGESRMITRNGKLISFARYWRSCKDIIYYLFENNGEVRRRDLAKNLPRRYHKSTISRALDRLERKRVIKKNETVKFNEETLPITCLFLEVRKREETYNQ